MGISHLPPIYPNSYPPLEAIKLTLEEEVSDRASQVTYKYEIVVRNRELNDNQRKALSRFVRDRAREMNAAMAVFLGQNAKVRVERSSSSNGSYYIDISE